MSATLLLTGQILELFARTWRQENISDPLVIARFFTPDSFFTWYATEFYPETGMFFWLVCGIEKELGYFSLGELQSVRGPLGLKVERDLYFVPTRLSELGL